MDWWRAYHGLPNDPKLALVAAVTPGNARRGEVLEVWIVLLDLASQATPRGSIEGYDAEQIGWMLELPAEKVEAIIGAFRQRKMIIGNSLAAWDKRNPKRERDDDSKERVRAYRERQKESGNAAPEIVTPSNAQRRGEEIRREEKKLRTSSEVLRNPSTPAQNGKTSLARPLSKYPKAAVALREPFPSTDDTFVMRLVQAVCQATISAGIEAPPGDALIADAIRECRRTTPRQQSPGLFLQTVPQCVKTWLQNGRSISNGTRTRAPTRAEEIQAMRQLIASADEPAELKAKWRQKLQEYGALA